MDTATPALPVMRVSTRAALLLALLASGCAGNKEAVIPSTGPTMAQIYRNHMAVLDAAAAQVRERLPVREPRDRAPSAYTRTAASEIDSRFARLPNPDLVMYVFPHLAGGARYPVPGYATVFPMYEGVEYALPGETAPARQREPLAAQAR